MDETKALELLRLLADGIDPSTGEILPADSIMQRPDIVRALGAACLALEKPARQGESRAGLPWSRTEDSQLLSGHDQGLTVHALAQKLGRTVGAIRARLLRFGRITQ